MSTHFPHALLLFSLFCLHDLSSAAFIRSKEISNKCCEEKKRECCLETIEFLRPMHCFSSDRENVDAANCVEDEIQGNLYNETFIDQLTFNDSKEARQNDLDCCVIFEVDDNDVTQNCFRTCKNVLLLTSLNYTEKLMTMAKCRRNNQLFKFFQQCREGGARTRSGLINKYIGGLYRMRDGKNYYVGNALDRLLQSRTSNTKNSERN